MKEVNIISKVVGRDGASKNISPGAMNVPSADLSGYLPIKDWNEVFSVRTDANGVPYLFGKLPFVTQYGITMYADGGELNLPSIYAGIPFDNKTIWLNPETKKVEVIGWTGGEGGGGVADSVHWNNIQGKPTFALVATSGKYADLSGLPDLSVYATTEYLTAELKKYVTRNTEQTIGAHKDFLNGLSIGGLGITKSQDDVIYLDANLVVRGGITMYAFDSGFKPSTVMDAIVVDGTTISKANGYLEVIGGTGGGLTEVSWDDVVGKPTLLSSFTDDVVAGKYLPLSGGTLTGKLNTQTNAYYGDGNYGINLANSDIVGVNTIYFNDLAQNNGEGINFARTNGNWDVLRAEDGILKFAPNYVLSSVTTDAYTIYHSGNCKPNDANRLVSFYGNAVNNELLDRPTTANVTFTDKSLRYFLATSSMTEGKPSNDAMIIHCGWDNKGWNAQLAIPSGYDTSIQWRNQGDGSIASKATVWNNWKTILDTYNYSSYALPLSGGTIASPNVPLMIQRTTANFALIGYKSATSDLGYLGFSTDGNLVVSPNRQSGNTTYYDVIHSGNISSYNAGSATKLQTARTIWGQSFDGTENITGEINLSTSDQINGKDGIALNYDSGANVDTVIWNGNKTRIASFLSSGNVGIGTASPGTNLHIKSSKASPIILESSAVECGIRFVTAGSSINGRGWIGFHNTHGLSLYNYNSESYGFCMYDDGNVALCKDNGNVGIGYSTPTEKIDILNNQANTNTFVHTKRGDTGYGVSFGVGSGGVNRGIYDDTNEKWMLYSDSTSNVIFPKGNIGIGTTAPNYNLHVVGSTYLNGNVIVDTLNTYSIIPRASITYDLGGSTSKWRDVYTESVITEYVHGGGKALYLGNSGNTSYIYVREDMKASSESWSLDTGGNMLLLGNLTSGTYGSNCVAKFQGIGTGNGYCSVVELITNNEVSISYSNSSRYSDPNRWTVGRLNSNYAYRFNFWNASYNGSVSYLDLSGNLWVAGGITMYSDIRKKTKIADVELSLKQIADAPLIEHYYNSDSMRTTHVGSIAQYWAGLNDWFCKLDNDGYYTMEIQNAALASAISIARELVKYESKTDKEIRMLKDEVKRLKKEIKILKSA